MAIIISRMISMSSSHTTYATTVLSILMRDSDRAQDIGLTPLSIAGLGLVVVGAWLREKCYRALGPLFTIELAIRKDHKLVTTGPYGVVRHPSYAGILAVQAGLVCWFCSPGSWLRESGVLESTVGSGFVYVSGLILGFIIMFGVSRMGREEKELRKAFGGEWDAWARRVPYRLVPGLY